MGIPTKAGTGSIDATDILLAQGKGLVGNASGYGSALTVARGSIVRGDSSGYAAAYSGKSEGKLLMGDGTDVVASSWDEAATHTRRYASIDFTTKNQTSLFAKNTMAIATAANSQEDYFRMDNHYFELSQGTANTALAATGLTPGATGWLLPGDNTAADWMEITRGIVLGSATSYLSGTDAFFVRAAFLISNRNRHTHLYLGFRNLAAYADAKTNNDHLAAYDDKFAFGVSTNAGVITRHTSKATTDAALNAAHAAAADGDILALEISCAASLVTTYKIGHATPAGATAAQTQAAVAVAYANLATDATIAGTAFSATTAIEFVPYIVVGMAGGTDISTTRLCKFEHGLV
jgi:hypothetical protein